MNIAKKTVITALASGALLLNSFMPVFAETTVVISGNGAGSENYATLNQSSTTAVSQTNNAEVKNIVESNATTGGNTASFNTGGSTAIGTGDAKTTTVVANDLNQNAAQVACCAQGDTTVKVDGNGAFSENQVKLDMESTTAVSQDNNADVYNKVEAKASTGENKASLNTGGDTTIVTGDAETNVGVSTKANRNSAVVGGSGLSGAPSASFEISGNGAGSSNWITAELAKTTAVTQTNEAEVDNKVEASAKTGYNTADFNTGGDVLVKTGDATTNVAVDNMVNFNYAALDCGCAWDVSAKIAGNGAGYGEGPGAETFNWFFPPASQNAIQLGLDSVQVLGQGNLADLYNKVDEAYAKTGGNTDTLNTGPVVGDPSYVITGNAETNTGVSNSGNVNVDGGTNPLTWPFGDSMVSFNWNWAQIMAWFSGLMS